MYGTAWLWFFGLVRTILTWSMTGNSRQEFYGPIFGEPRGFLQNILQTYKFVLICCFEERYNLSLMTNNKNKSFCKVAYKPSFQHKVFQLGFKYRLVFIPFLWLPYCNKVIRSLKSTEHNTRLYWPIITRGKQI